MRVGTIPIERCTCTLSSDINECPSLDESLSVDGITKKDDNGPKVIELGCFIIFKLLLIKTNG